MWTMDFRTDYTPTIRFREKPAPPPPDSVPAPQTAPPPADPRADIPRAEWEDFKIVLRDTLRPFPDAWQAFLAAVRAIALPHLYGPQTA